MINQPTELKTERLTLRPFVLSDAKDVQRLAGDRAVADTTANIPYPYKDGLAEAWIESHPRSLAEGKGVTFAVVLSETQRPAVSCSKTASNMKAPVADIP